jgi:hypothetical protein
VVGQCAGHELADVLRCQVPVLGAGEHPPVGAGDRRGEVVADRHGAQLAALAVDQERGAGRPAGEVAAMHARYLGSA